MPPKKTTASLKKTIEGRITKRIGEGVIQDTPSDPKHWFRTGCPALDVAISGKVGKGLPAGRVVEIFGNEDVGKTTLGCTIMQDVQKQGGLAFMIDTEGTFSTDRANGLGLDLSALTYIKEMYMEPILDGIDTIVTSAKDVDQPIIIFWDTIAGTPSLKERGRSTGDAPLGVHARALSSGLRKFVGKLDSTKCLVLCCNQLKLGDMTNPYASDRNKDSTLGGSAVKFHSDVRIKLKFIRKTWNAAKTRTLGFEVDAVIIKNKHGPSNVKARLMFRYDNGVGKFDIARSVCHTLGQWGEFNTNNKKIKFNGEDITIGTFVKRYNTDTKFRKTALKRLEERYQEEFKHAAD